MDVRTQPIPSFPGLAPTQYRVSGSTSVVEAPASIVEVPFVRPPSLGLMDEFEQETA